MDVLDIFKGNAFNLAALTDAINRIPFQPRKLGALGLFKSKGVMQNTVILEERDGVLMLIPTAPRGAPAPLSKKRDRRARSFAIPHIPLDDTVLAAEMQGVRAFGSPNAQEDLATVVNDKIAVMRTSHELTLEYHRLGALKGIVFDADGTSVLYDWYKEFGVPKQPDADFDLGTAGTSQKKKCLDLERLVEEALGGAPFSHVHAYCGKTWFDAFVEHATVKTAYERYRDGAFLRDSQRRTGFEFANIVFEEYRGKIGATQFVADDEARFFPVGADGIFMTYFGPGDFTDSLGAVGRPYYARQQEMDMKRGINIHTQSNPLCICTRPQVLVRGYTSS